MRLAVVGSKTFDDYEKLSNVIYSLTYLTQLGEDITIISGGAKGADSLAEKYAKENDLPESIVHRPDWQKYGKPAGFIRNQLIVDNCDVVLAFWDGKSSGTADTIQKAKVAKKPTFIIYF